MQYVVIENTPGYLPDAEDPATFNDLSSAKEYLREEVERYTDYLVECAEEGTPEKDIFSIMWSEHRVEAFVIDHSKMHDIGRNFFVDVITDHASQ